MESMAYRLAIVSEGLADASLDDVAQTRVGHAAGVALVRSVGGNVDCVGTSRTKDADQENAVAFGGGGCR